MPAPRYSDELLLELARDAVAALGPDLTAEDCARHMRISSATLRNHFRSWSLLRQKLGLPPRGRANVWNRRHSRETLIAALQALAAQHGPTLSFPDFCRHTGITRNVFYHHFPSWSAGRAAAHLPPPLPRNTKHTNDQLLELGRAAYEALGCNLTQADFARHAGVSAGTILYRFGGWQPFRDKIGRHPKNPGCSKRRTLTHDDILDRLHDYADRHGPHFSQREFAARTGVSAYLISHRFGSFTAARERADLPPVPRLNHRRYSDEFLLEDLDRVARSLGHIPTRDEYRRLGDVNIETLLKRFGRDWPDIQRRLQQWREFRAAFPHGLPPLPRHLPERHRAQESTPAAGEQPGC
jgi:hypothetical protein